MPGLIHADSADVTLGEQADVLVAEIDGALPFYRKSPGAIFDVRDRLLRPGGAVIPMTDTVMAAVVSAQASFARIVEPWEYARIDGAAGRRRALNECGREPNSSGAVPVVAPVRGIPSGRCFSPGRRHAGSIRATAWPWK